LRIGAMRIGAMRNRALRIRAMRNRARRVSGAPRPTIPLPVPKNNLKGKRIHDANIVATMRENGLKRLKTYNQGDFSTFEDIQFALSSLSPT
jgi:hypothetical protein